MKKVLLLFLIFLVSCNSSELSKEFTCTKTSFSNLETTSDIRNLFKVQLPKHWKTNLYYDNSQTSIYAADTTKSLTKSVLIDVTLVHNPLAFNDEFLQKTKNKELELQLQNLKAKEIYFLEKPSYLQHSKGKKGKYAYEIINLFSKVNSDNFLHSKIEVYGDSLVNERLCKAINLLEKIKIE